MFLINNYSCGWRGIFRHNTRTTVGGSAALWAIWVGNYYFTYSRDEQRNLLGKQRNNLLLHHYRALFAPSSTANRAGQCLPDQSHSSSLFTVEQGWTRYTTVSLFIALLVKPARYQSSFVVHTFSLGPPYRFN